MKKSKIINLIISIAAPILLVTAVVLIISYGWYVRKQQIATIDANAKNLAIDYTFDSDQETNKITYDVKNLVFFDNDSEFEYQYLSDMAVKLEINLTNKSSNPVSYKITFNSTKIVTPAEGDPTSIAYVDCIFNSIPAISSDIKTIDTARVDSTTVTYTNSDTDRTAVYDSGEVTLAAGASLTAPIVLYLYGIQEIDLALNEPFLYVNSTTLVDSYVFTLTIESVPVGAVEEEENPETPANNNQG